MIGYYVHHHGRGHLHRAMAVAAATEEVVVGLSSLPRPADWAGPWVALPRDDEASAPVDVSAHGRLHWVPEKDAGLTSRMAEISSWIAHIEPDLMFVDVSAEVSLLARLHGIPVVTMVLPGDRRDSAHDLVHSVARRIIAAWPGDVVGMAKGLAVHRARLTCVGGLSRFDDRPTPAPPPPRDVRKVVVLGGAGNADGDDPASMLPAERTPGWEWQLAGPGGTWVDDPWELLCDADVVVTHAGQNALAEVAAARRPAIVVPQLRPFGEQDVTAAVLATDGRFPVTVCSGGLPKERIEDVLEETAKLDGSMWAGWNDGSAASRVAQVIREELARVRGPQP